ncbi:MAG: hypothetical protein JST54_33165 [Deltaproteobacteria bacterium]|nr:hypothetical protein [Deltaproteobacteria bacterium]
MQPVIDSFTATPTAITQGGIATLAWTTENASAITLDPGGLHPSGTSFQVSPTSTTLYTLTAANDAGATQATATVTVYPPVSVQVAPPVANVQTLGTAQFLALTDAGVSWTVDEGASGGSVSQSGLYAAPSVGGTFHVRATSTANPLVSASAQAVVEFPDSGTLDLSFGAEGALLFAGPGNVGLIPTKILPQPTDNVIVAGASTNGQFVLKLAANGGLDPNFGTTAPGYTFYFPDGGFPLDIASTSPSTFAIAVGDPPGGALNSYEVQGISTLGQTSNSPNAFFAHFKFDAGGGPTIAQALTNTTGHLVVGGIAGGGAAFVGLLLDGGVDTQFGTGGSVLASTLPPPSVLGGLQPGTMMAAGAVSSPSSWKVWELGSSGQLPYGFGTVTIPMSGGSTLGPALWLGTGVILSGSMNVGAGSGQLVLTLVNSDGGLDQQFGSGGLVVGPMGNQGFVPTAIAGMPNGDFLVATMGATGSSQQACLISKFLPTGSLDTTFGNAGTTQVRLGGGTTSCIGLFYRSDDRIEVITQVDNGANHFMGEAMMWQ